MVFSAQRVLYSLFSILYCNTTWADPGGLVHAIVSGNTTIYRDADSSSEKLGTLPKGKRIRINPAKKNGFYSISLSQLWKGTQNIWVPESSIQVNAQDRKVASSELISATVSQANATIYREADVTSEKLSALPKGRKLRINPEKMNGFYSIALRQPWKNTQIIWIEENSITLSDSTRDSQETNTQSNFNWFNMIQLNSIYLSNSVGSSETLLPAWTPGFRFGAFQIQADLGVMPLRNANQTLYFAIEYALMPSYAISDSLRIHALVGMQYWGAQASNCPTLGGLVSYRLAKSLSVQSGYSAFLSPDTTTSQFRLGVGFEF